VSTLDTGAPLPATGELSYAAALRAIEDRGRFGIRLGLGRVRALLRAVDDPQLAVRGALVAGTNGKGSVIALAASALRAAGYHVAETPKPHLVSYRERIVVDGRPIDPDSFARLVARVLPVADRIASRLGPPTEFELLTAVMFLHFAEAAPDVALVEVGLGGRLDATHVWDGGVAVVTNVDLDHTDRLGPTVKAIAREKAAIIERGDVAVTGAAGEALAVIRRRCARLGTPLTVADEVSVVGWTRDTLDVALPRLGRVAVSLRGRHQAANVAVADALLDALETAGIARVSADDRRRGYATVRWPGRLELLEVPRRDGTIREVLLDGAHNPAGGAALAVALDDLRPLLAGGRDTIPPPITLVWAAMRDKDVAGVLTAVARSRSLAGARVVSTTLRLPRAMPAPELADAWRASLPGSRVSVAADIDDAMDQALATTDGPIVVAGSLYLVGAVRSRLVDDPLLRDPVAA
jgi:dihydrofolate synthase/folylpolyglutamate synthase